MRPVLLVLVACLTRPVLAAEPPACTAARAGLEICRAESVCTCAHQGGAAVRASPGWRWSCDIARMCGDQGPASLDPPWQDDWNVPVMPQASLFSQGMPSPGFSSPPGMSRYPAWPPPPYLQPPTQFGASLLPPQLVTPHPDKDTHSPP